MVDMRGARRIRGADPLVYPRAASRAPDTRSGAVMNSVSTDARTPPPWALWIVGIVGVAVCSLALLFRPPCEHDREQCFHVITESASVPRSCLVPDAND